MKKHDRGHLHLKLEGPRTDMSRPGIEPGPLPQTSTPLSLINAYRMSLISAPSISLDSTIKLPYLPINFLSFFVLKNFNNEVEVYQWLLEKQMIFPFYFVNYSLFPKHLSTKPKIIFVLFWPVKKLICYKNNGPSCGVFKESSISRNLKNVRLSL